MWGIKVCDASTLLFANGGKMGGDTNRIWMRIGPRIQVQVERTLNSTKTERKASRFCLKLATWRCWRSTPKQVTYARPQTQRVGKTKHGQVRGCVERNRERGREKRDVVMFRNKQRAFRMQPNIRWPTRHPIDELLSTRLKSILHQPCRVPAGFLMRDRHFFDISLVVQVSLRGRPIVMSRVLATITLSLGGLDWVETKISLPIERRRPSSATKKSNGIRRICSQQTIWRGLPFSCTFIYHCGLLNYGIQSIGVIHWGQLSSILWTRIFPMSLMIKGI